jgi:S1-C subfamily serine protease
VTLTDGRKLLATVKGADELTDLAVLQIEGSGASSSSTSTSHSHLFGSSSGSSSSSSGHQLMADATFPAAKLGNSEDLSVGDWVIAVSKGTLSYAIHHQRCRALHATLASQLQAAIRVHENYMSYKAVERSCSNNDR